MKSISSETTFERDLRDVKALERILWRQCERVSVRSKAANLGGRTVVLKLKTAAFRTKTRSVSLDVPTQLADQIFRIAREALLREADGTSYRLLGVGLANICQANACDPSDLADAGAVRRASAERAMDRLRTRFGDGAVTKGRGYTSTR